MAARVRAFDWSRTPLGPADRWPQSLRTAVGICLGSRFPMFLWWGPSLVNIYNDAYMPILGRRHPDALGRPAADLWREVWPTIGPQVDAVMARGEASWRHRVPLVVERNGSPEEAFFTWSHGPVVGEDGAVAGVLCVVSEETASVRAEQATRAAERQMRLLTDALPALIAYVDGDLRYRFNNRAYLDWFGTPPDQLVGKHLSDVLGEAEYRQRLPYAQVALRGETVRFEGTSRHRERGPVHCDLTYVPDRGPDGRVNGFVVLAQDVTERVRADEARRMSEFRFSRLVEHSPQSTQVFHPDGRTRQVNRAFTRLFGITLDQLRDYNILRDPELVRLGVMPLMERAFAGEAVTIDPIPYAPDRGEYAGQTRWAGAYVYPVKDDAGRVEEVVLVHLDVTEQKRAEHERERFLAAERAARAEAETLVGVGRALSGELDLHRLVQAATDAATDLTGAAFGAFFYAVPDPQGGHLTLYTISGVPKDEFSKFPVPRATDVFGPTLRGEAVVRSDDVTADPRYGRNAPYHGMPRGHLPVRSYLAVPVRSRSGEVLGAMFLGHPEPARFTERHERLAGGVVAQAAVAIDNARLYDRERAARAEAERQGRMKDEFLATLSHELRTPLNAILGWAQVLRTGGAGGARDAADVRQGLEVIERNARAQTRIIEDLLDMSRIVAGKVRLDVQRVPLAPVIEAAVDTVRPAAEARGVRLQVVLDPLAGPVSGDPARLQQVLWNLLSNSVKHTDRGGRVQVLLERVNSHVEVSVVDTGEGISPEFLPYVFDRFRQADASTTRRHGGLGLGLSIVKQLVELHGGTVRAKSPGVGHGATFTVALPLTPLHAGPDDDAERRHPRGGPDASPTGDDACVKLGGLRVLVVDDEPDARALVKRLLEDCEAVVTTAASAADALAALHRDRPDVLVSDVGMPGEDGYSLVRRVRALAPADGGDVPAVALTAYARSEDRTRAMLAGFHGHVAKPVEPAELVATVAALARRGDRR